MHLTLRPRRRLLALFGSAAIALSSTPFAAVTVATANAIHPAVSDFQFVKSGVTPPSESDCEAVARTCFTPQAIQSAYNVGPLYAEGLDGRGMTIGIVDSWGSDTMAHDLHVFDQAFGLQPMCGEEDVTCTAGMPWFKTFHFQGAPATTAQPGNGTHQEDKTLWALEVALDVEMSHAIAPRANILLISVPTAETLGVQGFPLMMNAEQYVIDHGMVDVISQSFASAEDAFGSSASLENLRHAYKSAAASGVTVLGSSGDSGSANVRKTPVAKGGSLIPEPTVEWPASDPLVTGVGGTYLCTDPTASTNDPRTTYVKPGIGAKCGSSTFNPGGIYSEVAWTFSGGGFSHVFSRPSYQNVLPAGSTAIPAEHRGVPDIAFQASAATGALVYLSLPPDGDSGLICPSGDPCSTGWYDIGGTSLSCPQWAGLVAIADQLNGGGLGLINPALYEVASNPATYAADYYDVHSGNTNQADPSVPGYAAGVGWDPVTGLGTPNAAKLIPDLVAAAH
jgi:subtilase family serine protease